MLLKVFCYNFLVGCPWFICDVLSVVNDGLRFTSARRRIGFKSAISKGDVYRVRDPTTLTELKVVNYSPFGSLVSLYLLMQDENQQ